MFIQIVTVYGFLGAWVGYFICYFMYLNGLVRNRQVSGNGINFDSFMQRMYGVVFMNIITGVVMVVIPLFLLLINIMPYWIVVGVFSTLFIYLVILQLIKKGETLMNREYTDKEKQVAKNSSLENLKRKSKRYTILFWVVGILNLGYFILLPLDAWDIIPITRNLLPTFMPIYLHMMMDWVRIGVIVIGGIILLIVANKRVVNNNILKIKKENITGNQLVS